MQFLNNEDYVYTITSEPFNILDRLTEEEKAQVAKLTEAKVFELAEDAGIEFEG